MSPDAFALNDPDDAISGDATRARIFIAAERLFATRGFAEVSVRDITTAANVNLAAVNYHFGSRDGLLLEIFRTRSTEINRMRARMLHEAMDRHNGKPPLRDILVALITPSSLWNDPSSSRFVAQQFLIRARSEGTEEIREMLRSDTSLLKRFSEAMIAACPDLPRGDLYWRLHFVLGMVHQNRTLELERLRSVSDGAAGHDAMDVMVAKMVDFAVAGFKA